MLLNKRWVLFWALWFVLAGLYGQCDTKNFVFSSGERVYYDAYYNWRFIWLNAGHVSFSVDKSSWRGQPAYNIKSIGGTQRGYDRLFRVRDTFEVYVDTMFLRPFEFRRITNEGSYSAHHHYIFNREKRTIWANISRGGEPFKQSVLDWPDCTFDILSMVYHARNINFDNFSKGDKIPITMLIDGEIHNLHIRFRGREVAKNRDGRSFNCLKFSPLLVEGTIFEAGEDMTVWVTDDKNRLPIVVEAKILIGSVKAIFSGAEGLKHPLSSEIFD